MHNPSNSSRLISTLGSVVQYSILALLAYILAGAPLGSYISSPSASSQHSASSSRAAEHVQISPDKLANLVLPEKGLECEDHALGGVHVVSREPLVLYVQGFLAGREVQRVLDDSTPHLAPSYTHTANSTSFNPLIRNSTSTPVPPSHALSCILARARALPGWRPHVYTETPYAQRYDVGGHYTYHYDWGFARGSRKSRGKGGWGAGGGSGRVSSWMVWLESSCSGGGTHFPRLPRPEGEEWCRFIECNPIDSSPATSSSPDANITTTAPSSRREKLTDGTIFKPIRGNAVYWENLREDGSGFAESWHAGLPVTGGKKMGLNIWSWWQEGWVPGADAGVAERNEEGQVEEEAAGGEGQMVGEGGKMGL